MSDKPNEPIDLAAHRERRARLEQQRLRQRAAAQAARDAAPSPEPGPGEVPCARCGEPIFGHVRQCPHCGVHFSSGGAEAFAPKQGLSRRTKCIVALVAVALLLAGLSDDIARWW
ncbi:hypothetical protein SAMN05216567_12375 [Variovorax sp. OK605]|uniref:hypothetical protein n=1 Tax=Variovorax sp. OK605 TaxID=1855317 RepID=UPI0008EBA4E7|nr:hypothetical protein [Variovorax sp. OK605]SFQ64217.1 hypothetical protein SAMN05216567_12375 [Variovorax sp. OK605]